MCSADAGSARIITAAMELFAAHGFEATGVRAIADAAGVSAPLIHHHFGSKEGLRRAVDEHAVAAVTALFGDLDVRDPSQLTAQVIEGLRGRASTLAYIRRSLQDGGPSGEALVDRLVEGTLALLADLERRGLARPADDPLARALVVLTLDLGSLVLEPHLARHLGEPVWSGTAASGRWFAAVMDVLAGGLLSTGPDPQGAP